LAMSEIREALAGLPREQRVAVLYRDVLGLSYGETAERMGTSVSAVTMLLHRGRQRLRQTLGATAGGLGLSRWLRRMGMPQVAAVKGAGTVVIAAGLATTGIVAAHQVAPIGADVTAAAPGTRSGSPTGGAVRTPGGGLTPASARPRVTRTGGSNVSADPVSTRASGGDAIAAAAPSVRSSPAEPAHPVLHLPLRVPTV